LRAVGWCLGALGEAGEDAEVEEEELLLRKRGGESTPTQGNYHSLSDRCTPNHPTLTSTLYSPITYTTTRSPIRTPMTALSSHHSHDSFIHPSSSSTSSIAASPSSPMLSFSTTTGASSDHPPSSHQHPPPSSSSSSSAYSSPRHQTTNVNTLTRNRSRTNSRSWGASSFTSLPGLISSPVRSNHNYLHHRHQQQEKQEKHRRDPSGSSVGDRGWDDAQEEGELPSEGNALGLSHPGEDGGGARKKGKGGQGGNGATFAGDDGGVAPNVDSS
jgi:hypothetical protein